MDRLKWGLSGLFAFEAIVASFLFGISADPSFVVSYALGAVVLGVALFTRPQRWHFAVLAFLSAYRAYYQFANGAPPTGVYPTWLVPIGFAWLAIAPTRMPRIAIGLVAVARTWFILWYYPQLLQPGGDMTLVVANVLGAAGAWLWLAAGEPIAGIASADDAPATQ